MLDDAAVDIVLPDFGQQPHIILRSCIGRIRGTEGEQPGRRISAADGDDGNCAATGKQCAPVQGSAHFRVTDCRKMPSLRVSLLRPASFCVTILVKWRLTGTVAAPPSGSTLPESSLAGPL